MSDSSDVGFVSLNSNMFFTCSSGITPAKICPTQNNHKTKENYSYLVKDDTATQSIGDFSCRWTLVLAAAIAAAGVVTGGAALLVLAAVAIAASMTLCGGLMAPMRKWVGYSTLNAYGKTDAYSLTSKCQMVCPIGGVIMFAPGITGFWSAALYASRNAGMAVLEGVVIGAFCKTGLGGIASGLKGLASTQALANIAFVSAFGVVDQVIFEGIVREGKRDSSLLENAGQGASWMAQPFINTAKRISSGYYSGGYAKDAEGNDIPEAHNGHGVGAAITDGYFDALTLGTLGLLGKHSSDGISYAKETLSAAKKFVEKGLSAGKKFLFERGKKTGKDRANEYSSGWPKASLSEAIRKFAGENPIVEGPTPKGKMIYRNPVTGIEVVYDINGNYFRINNPNLPGRRTSMDMDGNIPNNKTLPNGKQAGRSQSEYNEVTHFNNTDPTSQDSSKPTNIIPLSTDDRDIK